MVEGTRLLRVDNVAFCRGQLQHSEGWFWLTVEVGVVLELVSEERARDVDLLTSDDSDLLAHEDLTG